MTDVGAAASFTLHLAGLVPERACALSKGQQIEVRPAIPLPTVVEMGVPLATARR